MTKSTVAACFHALAHAVQLEVLGLEFMPNVLCVAFCERVRMRVFLWKCTQQCSKPVLPNMHGHFQWKKKFGSG